MKTINPEKIRYIKLGHGGAWEKGCIEKDGTIRLGYKSPYHKEALTGDWDKIRKFWLNERKGNEGSATRDINQIRDFYESSENDLWITFYKRRLYWCFAYKEVKELNDGTRIRKTINGWSCKDIHGEELRIENIDGRISKVQGFRGTICGVDLKNYLVSKISGKVQKEVKEAKKNISKLKESIKTLMHGLWWKDFELLTDLIFSQAGWQRVSILGKTEKAIDLDVFSPVTGRRAFIQVKSQASVQTLLDSIIQYKEMEYFDEMYFVVHTADKEVTSYKPPSNTIHILALDRLADLVINSGLVNWLITKRS